MTRYSLRSENPGMGQPSRGLVLLARQPSEQRIGDVLTEGQVRAFFDNYKTRFRPFPRSAAPRRRRMLEGPR